MRYQCITTWNNWFDTSYMHVTVRERDRVVLVCYARIASSLNHVARELAGRLFQQLKTRTPARHSLLL